MNKARWVEVPNPEHQIVKLQKAEFLSTENYHFIMLIRLL